MEQAGPGPEQRGTVLAAQATLVLPPHPTSG